MNYVLSNCAKITTQHGGKEDPELSVCPVTRSHRIMMRRRRGREGASRICTFIYANVMNTPRDIDDTARKAKKATKQAAFQ